MQTGERMTTETDTINIFRQAVVGLQMLFVAFGALVREGTNLSQPRNMVIVSLILVFGIGDMALGYSGFMVRGIGLTAIVGVVLNLILPKKIAVEEE